jgi:hypothetical protein
MPRFHVATGSYVFRQDWDQLLTELHTTEVEIADLLHAVWNADEKYWEENLERDLQTSESLVRDVQWGFTYITEDDTQDERERRFLRAGQQHGFHALLEGEEASAYFLRGEWAAAAAATITSATHARLALQCLIQLCTSVWTADGGFSDEARDLNGG